MKKSYQNRFYWLSSAGYALIEIAQGLFFHPYQTMYTIINGNYFSILLFTPLYLWLLLKIFFILMGRYFIPDLVLDERTWFVFSKYFFEHLMLLWQSALLYLIFRFKYAWKNRL